MSKTFRIFLVIAGLIVSVLSILSFPTHAQEFVKEYMVTAKNGVNIRDKNCKKVGAVGYENSVYKINSSTISCSINGNMQTLIRASEYASDAETYIS